MFLHGLGGWEDDFFLPGPPTVAHWMGVGAVLIAHSTAQCAGAFYRETVPVVEGHSLPSSEHSSGKDADVGESWGEMCPAKDLVVTRNC